MSIKTTVIGAWPKPSYLKIKDWFQNMDDYVEQKLDENDESKELLEKAIDEVVAKQLDLGIDIITDGEMERGNYFLHFVKHIKGMNPENLAEKVIRDGACKLQAVSIESKLEAKEEWAYLEWQKTVKSVEKWLKAHNFDGDVEAEAKSRVKYTLPGPMTIMDCTHDTFYGEEKKRELIDDLIEIINKEILSLAKHGCKYIQLDEPVLMRYPENAESYGIQDAGKCFKDLPEDCTSIVHLCCGYPSYVDQDDYKKADKTLYAKLGPQLDGTGIKQISMEDAEAQNDLEVLLPNYKNMTIIFGSVAVARSKIEDFEKMKERVENALKLLGNDPSRIVLAPDCGLGFLTEEQILAKLDVMVKVAKDLNQKA